MTGMTTKERIEDICNISGLTEPVVRSVIEAERKSIAKSLRRGERATLIGRVVINPEIRTKIAIGGDIQGYIKLNISPTESLLSLIRDASEFEKDDRKIPYESEIRLMQIPSLV